MWWLWWEDGGHYFHGCPPWSLQAVLELTTGPTSTSPAGFRHIWVFKSLGSSHVRQPTALRYFNLNSKAFHWGWHCALFLLCGGVTEHALLCLVSHHNEWNSVNGGRQSLLVLLGCICTKMYSVCLSLPAYPMRRHRLWSSLFCPQNTLLFLYWNYCPTVWYCTTVSSSLFTSPPSLPSFLSFYLSLSLSVCLFFFPEKTEVKGGRSEDKVQVYPRGDI